MIEYFNPNFNSNMKALLQGMWYTELPTIVDVERICGNLEDVLHKIEQNKYAYYVLKEDGFIEDFKGICSPSYLRKPGVEPITYYAFKRNKSLREMQLVNLIHYCAFIYDSLYVFNDIFAKLYINEEHSKYVSNSNSYVVTGESFYIDSGYEFEEIDEGVFINGNNKTASWIKIEDGKMRIQQYQKSKLYFMKLDIESFFPNLYTHYLARIARYEPYKSLDVPERYYVFLDKFHQRINDNQTKGVPAGNFSSHIGAELLMLCVDYDIRKVIGDEKIGYVRYVDDMTFYCDDKQKLDNMIVSVQKILTNYRLRINGNKIKKGKATRNKGLNISKAEIYEKFPYLITDTGNRCLRYENLSDVKNYIADLLNAERTGQIKTILTCLLNKLAEGKISFEEEIPWFYYFQALALDDESVACHAYRILDKMLKNTANKDKLLCELEEKREFIDVHYSDSLIQIWHYYVMTENMDEVDKNKLFMAYTKNIRFINANPIIICYFINEGNNKNQVVWKYISKGYLEQTGETDWKKRIMFSKWWLPIFKIRMVDNHNYQNFLQTSLFPEILADLAKK